MLQTLLPREEGYKKILYSTISQIYREFSQVENASLHRKYFSSIILPKSFLELP